MWMVYTLVILLFSSTAGARNLLGRVEVPQYAFEGEKATLKCIFNLRATRLYSLKWYHNNTEFYRYVPTERKKHFTLQPSSVFTVTEVFRSEREVVVSLGRLRRGASGHYRCEVIAEHPSFRTEAAGAYMMVLAETLGPPVLVGGREIYEPTEVIKVGCQARVSSQPAPRPSLQWLIEGNKVDDRWVRPYATPHGHHGIALHVPGRLVAEEGGSMRAECQATLGTHRHSAYKVLRVRVRLISYLDDYYSTGTTLHTPGSRVTAVVAAAVVVLKFPY
ncbi:uncharacterized protein LOC135094267 [Scylla paramamosain]|uniref:uncharacterized protein LOC135094267 n=1 Tax=Scylla paramamosain TaxID=85552 RepID=UPI003083B3E0